MLCLDKNGCLIECIKGQYIRSFIRKLIYTRKFYRGTIDDWNKDNADKIRELFAVLVKNACSGEGVSSGKFDRFVKPIKRDSMG